MTTVGIGLGSYGQCKKERKIMTTVGIGLGVMVSVRRNVRS